MKNEKFTLIIVMAGIIGINEEFNNSFTFALLVMVVAYSCYKLVSSRKGEINESAGTKKLAIRKRGGQ